MIVQENEFTLKDGRKAFIRSPEPENAEEVKAVLSLITQACGETDFLLRYPEEWENMSLDSEKSYLEGLNKAENEAMLLCFVGGKVAGNCFISRKTGLKTRHRATLGISILREYWNLGIGTRLFAEIIRLAKSLGVSQLELDFIEGNSRARALYEKMGFRITGVIPDAVQLKDGRLLNEYSMMRKI